MESSLRALKKKLHDASPSTKRKFNRLILDYQKSKGFRVLGGGEDELDKAFTDNGPGDQPRRKSKFFLVGRLVKRRQKGKQRHLIVKLKRKVL